MHHPGKRARLVALEADLHEIAGDYTLWRDDVNVEADAYATEVDKTIAALAATITLLRAALPACNYIPF